MAARHTPAAAGNADGPPCLIDTRFSSPEARPAIVMPIGNEGQRRNRRRALAHAEDIRQRACPAADGSETIGVKPSTTERNPQHSHCRCSAHDCGGPVRVPSAAGWLSRREGACRSGSLEELSKLRPRGNACQPPSFAEFSSSNRRIGPLADQRKRSGVAATQLRKEEVTVCRALSAFGRVG